MTRKLIAICSIIIATTMTALAQDVERERPQEWNKLVRGARFIDRFNPLAKGKTEKGIWGAKGVQGRYVDNGLERSDISFWGGNIIETKEGTYRAYICGWPESHPKGHMAWPSSKVYLTEAKELDGPYSVVDTIGIGHNPEAIILKDGRTALYVAQEYRFPGFYISEDGATKWRYQSLQVDPRDRRVVEGLSNLSFAKRKDNSFLMVCRGGGIWVSRNGVSPYYQISDQRVYPAIEGRFEDPVIWRDEVQYHLIVNDWLGRVAYYERSKDGIEWVVEQGEAYTPGIARHHNGKVEDWYKFERIKVFQDDHGRVIQTNFAVNDTIKREDKGRDIHSSKNICIPMNKGLLLSILNKERITESTPKIEVRIEAEEGFAPNKEVDIKSLRFGSYNVVNFGNGGKVIDSRADGDDLIVTFDGTQCAIDSKEFAPKLIGQTKRKALIYGYSRLPHVEYDSAIITARKPQFLTTNSTFLVDVENFGLATSKPLTVEILDKGSVVAETKLGALKPYARVTLFATDKARRRKDSFTDLTVRFRDSKGNIVVHNHFSNPNDEHKPEKIKTK